MNQQNNVAIPIKIKYPDINLRAFFYFLSLGIYMVYSFLSISFYQNAVISSGIYILEFCFVLLVIAELTNFEYKRFDLYGIIFIAFIMIVTYIVVGNVWWRPFLWIVLFAFGARHIQFNKIAKFALIISTFCFAFIILSSVAGVIPDYLDTTTHLGVTRHYLGFLYCLYAPTVLFNIEALYLYLRAERLKWFELVICIGIAYVFYRLCDARLNFILNLLMVIGFCVVKYRKNIPQSIRKNLVNISKMMPWIFIVCGMVSIILSFGYNESISWLAKINASLGNRLGYGHISYQRYGLSAFGQVISMHGSGLSGNGLRGRGEYFYLDCLYVRFLQEYGIVFSCLMLFALTIVMYRMVSQKKYYLIIILTVLGLHAMVDDLILLPYYNTFWIVCIYFLVIPQKKLNSRINIKTRKIEKKKNSICRNNKK